MTTTSIPPSTGPSPDELDELAQQSPFERWVGGRTVAHLGSNGGAAPLAFQRWHHFKEAFPPELIQQMINEDEDEVSSCLDVFGGSGTTALSSQLLGIASTTIEINPFLTDVIRAKTSSYNCSALSKDLEDVIERAEQVDADPAHCFEKVPSTFIEPGMNDRWVFDFEVAERLASLLVAIEEIDKQKHRRLFRVLVGGIFAEVSNVVINGKGRRYRRNWQDRRREASKVLELFTSRAQDALRDIEAFTDRPKPSTRVLRGDARSLSAGKRHDLSIFSPPYPNSFDYTDIYNLELWMLGYLNGSGENRDLRKSTLSSHVQLQRKFSPAPDASPTLTDTLEQLEEIRAELWNPWIPNMVGAYFADMLRVLKNVGANIHEGRRCCIVIGDSRYGGVLVPAAKALGELSEARGWKVERAEPVRAMRSSAQHGGSADLDETLLILSRRPG